MVLIYLLANLVVHPFISQLLTHTHTHTQKHTHIHLCLLVSHTHTHTLCISPEKSISEDAGQICTGLEGSVAVDTLWRLQNTC